MTNIGSYAPGTRALVAPFLLYLLAQPEVKAVKAVNVKDSDNRTMYHNVLVSFQQRHPTALAAARVLQRTIESLRIANAGRQYVEPIEALYETALDQVGEVTVEHKMGAVLRALQACADRNITPVSFTLNGVFAELSGDITTSKEG
jgi:hypothetical protein